jgi:hypothetical protein
MVHRHVLDDGQVRYCTIDELPAEAGGGFHGMVTSTEKVLAAQHFDSRQKAQEWIDGQMAGHKCGTRCWRASVVSVS